MNTRAAGIARAATARRSPRRARPECGAPRLRALQEHMRSMAQGRGPPRCQNSAASKGADASDLAQRAERPTRFSPGRRAAAAAAEPQPRRQARASEFDAGPACAASAGGRPGLRSAQHGESVGRERATSLSCRCCSRAPALLPMRNSWLSLLRSASRAHPYGGCRAASALCVCALFSPPAINRRGWAYDASTKGAAMRDDECASMCAQ